MIKKIHIERFRGFKNSECVLGSQITAIAGQNGTQKTILLGLLSQPFSITDADNPMINEVPLCGGNFKSAFADKFKFSPTFDIPKGHEWTLYVDGNDPFTLESISRDKKTNKIRFYRKGDHRKGAGYLQYPVIFLSLKRLLPIGEDVHLTESNRVQLQPEEINEFKKLHEEILDTGDRIDNPQYVESNNKNTLGVNTASYDWRLNSAGQDNLGKIILALLSFRRLFNSYTDSYKGGILAIDELDCALYPASQIKLLGVLRHYAAKYQIQVIFTTHSLSLLEEVCKKYQESLLHKSSNGQIQVVFLEKQDGLVKFTNIKAFQTINNRLNISLQIETPKKLTVFTEDEEARVFLRNLLPVKWRNRIRFESCTMGCDDYITLIKKKINAFQLPLSCIVLDADAKSKVDKIRWKTLGVIKNTVCLPGVDSPERELAKLLYDREKITDANTFWRDLNSDYSRQYCFHNYKYDDIMRDRDKAKAWFKEQLPVWGKTSNKAVALWIRYNLEAVEQFRNEFKDMINAFASAYELDPLS